MGRGRSLMEWKLPDGREGRGGEHTRAASLQIGGPFFMASTRLRAALEWFQSVYSAGHRTAADSRPS
jgi:hypothetical protein